ncbi:MAG: glycosyltransferase [Chitinivibrionales bacterium]|nr:glycosyltransferase [Chitinivibrionales bacterium]MBD3357680.1 glycosyltransferase [Chitinivibrionales bacterium]
MQSCATKPCLYDTAFTKEYCRGPARPMKILIINWRDIEHPEGGGAEVHLHEIFSRLVRRGHQVTLLTTAFRGAEREKEIGGLKILRWGHTFTFNWEAPFLARRILARQAVDCIVDDVNKIPFFSPRWFHSVPTCVFFHHLFGNTIFELTVWPCAAYVLMLERLSGWGYRNVPCCTVSKSTADELVGCGFDRSRIVVIENSVDTDRYRPSSAVSKESGMLLYAGRIKSYKNVEIALDALKSLLSKGRRDLRLVISGTGDHEPALKAYAGRLGLENRVRFLGYTEEERQIDLYRRATIFVNTSLKEGWGITNIEAGACGTAVVANNAPGLRDSVKDGETGLLYSENNQAHLEECIERLLDDESLRKKFELNGRKWALHFSWDRSAERVEEWLMGVVGKK